MKKASKIICVSDYEKGMVVKHFGVADKKIIVIPNGVETFVAVEHARRKADEFRILYVGRLDFATKNVDKLIEGFSILNRRNAKLVIIGNGPDRDKVIKIIDDLDLHNRVELIMDATKEGLAKEYHNADLFVMPSVYESFGMAVTEALAAGIKTIVSKSGALTELVHSHYAYGIDLPVTAEKVANAITEVADAKIQFNRYSNYHDWDTVAKELNKVYHSIML